MSASVTAHDKMPDGSYQLVVTDDDGNLYPFTYGAFDPAWTLHEGGPAMTENDYIDAQRAESVALVEQAAPVEQTEPISLL